jgi:hypothetical protein
MAVDFSIEEKIGNALIRREAMRREEVEAVLKLQNAGDDRLFGEIAVDIGFLDVRELIDYLRR